MKLKNWLKKYSNEIYILSLQCTYISICISIVVQYSHVMNYLTEQSIKNLMISYMYRLSSIVL